MYLSEKSEQHGFQQGKSCESQLIDTINDFVNILNKGEEIDALFLDFSKAFDKVPHHRLLHKLANNDLCSQFLNWTKDFLIGRSQAVLLEGHSSSSSEVLSGVPQGTVLAPLLFTCYVNDDIPSTVKSKIKLYADDILLYRTIHTDEDLNKYDWGIWKKAEPVYQ